MFVESSGLPLLSGQHPSFTDSIQPDPFLI